MYHIALDQILAALAVDVHEVALCEFAPDSAIAAPPLDAIEVHFVLGGTLYIQIGDDRDVAVPEGSVVIVPPGVRQRMAATPSPATVFQAEEICNRRPDGLLFLNAALNAPSRVRIICGEVRADVGGSFGALHGLSAPICAHLSDEPVVRAAFEVMLRETADLALGSRALVGALMKACLIVALRRYAAHHGIERTLPGLFLRPSLARAVAAVVQNPAAPYELNSLARAAGMSRSGFAKAFSDTLGATPMEFVARARLTSARELLLSTPLPVSAIASQVGFANRSHFSRAFRKTFGIDPSSLRRGNASTEVTDAL
ncbi:helix-turn-helix domain-containing protein [Sphingobium sp. AS12]|nr:AraC family transcriptional regulator [Sphingobium sp. AS12]MBV2150112.1 helix-turn-helix domain-containing protein [Sphingobium sp. AS12]